MARTKTSRAPGRRPFAPVAVFAALVAAYWATAAFVISTDPLDLYPWGVRPTVANKTQPLKATELFSLAAKDPDVDLLVVGSSTTMAYTPDVLVRAIPGVSNPWNLSYYAPRPADRAILLDRLLQTSKARRIIVNADWMYSQGVDVRTESFPAHLYDDNVLNDLRAVNLDTIRLAIRAARGQDLIGGGRGDPEAATNAARYRSFQTPGRMRSLAAEIERYRPVIDKPSSLRCQDFPALETQLVPFARKASAKGVRVDILIPPFSVATWYDWRSNTRRSAEFGESVFEDQLTLRRCLVEAMHGIPGVSVYAFDDDPAVSTDLAAFRDPAHMHDPEALLGVLTGLAAGRGRLDTDNVDAYLARLRALVKNYRLTNSRFPQYAPKTGKQTNVPDA